MRDTDRDEGAADGPAETAEWSAPPARLRAIEEAAWQHFSRGGYDAVGLAKIAADVGLARSTVQGYVGSKRRLYQRCLERALSELEKALAEAVASGGEAQERVRMTLVGFVNFSVERPDAWTLISRHLFASAGPFAQEGARLRGRLVPALEEVLLGGEEAVAGGAVGSAVLGLLRVLTDPDGGAPHGPPDELVDRLFDVVWSGVSAELRRAT